ncbi:glycosyltransferase [Methanobrevibacter sp. OttesenSCG-928-K11]|nr:glycosyltransferase [Methanobrevibacter sp. OttesenSCG-928-K11]MDL2271343.1 glycosyltransferase [Methanobrevibacter sp. OttesenSCG-928-I08]
MTNINISIIIPLYNGSRYIQKTLDSVINQNFNNYEIIIVDDGSTDDSLDKTKKILSKTDISTQIISQKNKGASNARNKGLSLAKGQYILFLDDDDYIDSNHMKYLYDVVKENKTDFAFTKILKFNVNGDILTNLNEYDFLNNKKVISSLDLIKADLEMKIPFSFSLILYNSKILKENNITFNESNVYGEDTEFAIKALYCGNNVSIVNKPTYFYLQHAESATSNLYLKRFSIVEIFENLADFFKNNEDKHSKEENIELENLIKYNRVPKAIFGNLMYFFYNNYDIKDIFNEMERLNLFSKLADFKMANFRDILFLIKTKVFLTNPTMYYKVWKTFKNSI